jgi:hypothetical protein
MPPIPPRQDDDPEANAHVAHSIATRNALIEYLKQRREQLQLTSEGAAERTSLDRWITWLKGAI